MTITETPTVSFETIVATERREQDRRLRETFVRRDRKIAEGRLFEAFRSIEARP